MSQPLKETPVPWGKRQYSKLTNTSLHFGVAFISAVPQETVTTALKLFTFWQDKRNCNPRTL